jgi:hypothetical protein
MPIIPTFRKLRLEDYKLEASLSYMAKPCIKNTK